MENTQSTEQPCNEILNSVDVNEQIINIESATSDLESNKGSEFGKFKDATSLLNAYNNLEKEFTKKSQKLAELTKLNDQKAVNNSLETIADLEQKSSDKLDEFCYNQTSWQSKVSKFFEKNPEARAYSKEIAKNLLNDRNLAKNENCLDYAYALVNNKNSVKPADFLNDPNTLNKILENDLIKNKIISNYLKGINENKHNLMLISGEPKGISPTQPTNKPKTIKEASMVLKKLLQN